MQLVIASTRHRAWHTAGGMPKETASLPSKVFKMEPRGKGSVCDTWVSGHLDPPCFSFTLSVNKSAYSHCWVCCVSLRFFLVVIVQISQILHLTKRCWYPLPFLCKNKSVGGTRVWNVESQAHALTRLLSPAPVAAAPCPGTVAWHLAVTAAAASASGKGWSRSSRI